MMILGTLAIVFATIAIGMFVDRKVGLLPHPDRLRRDRRLPAPGPGEAGANPLRLTEGELARARTQVCCGPMTALPDDAVRVGHEQVTVLRFRCPRCGKQRSLYAAAAG